MLQKPLYNVVRYQKSMKQQNLRINAVDRSTGKYLFSVTCTNPASAADIKALMGASEMV